MQLSNDNRKRLMDGLDRSIRVKRNQIERIKTRTEEDFKMFLSSPKIYQGTLEDLIREDIMEVEEEINELQQLRESINNLDNQILFVPKTIQLHLHAEEKQ